MLDLAILAFVAIFLGFRLWSILGQHDDSVGEVPRRGTAKRPKLVVVNSAEKEALSPFELDQHTFLKGAKKAYEVIVKAFTEGDQATLKKLLAPDLFQAFRESIVEREQQGQYLESELLRILNADIADIKTDKATASVVVQFKAEQTTLMKDKSGAVLQGDADIVTIVVERWTFERPTKSNDTAWLLVATESAEDAAV